MFQELLFAVNETRNDYYLSKYISFVERFNDSERDVIERHHILPKSIFPEYTSFTQYPWNKASLSPREHFVAHQLLHKAFPDNDDIFYSIWCMKHQNGVNITAKKYDELKRKYRVIASKRAKGKIVVKDSEGKTYKVDVDDPRRLSGELVPFSTGISSPKTSTINYRKPKSKEHKDNIAKYRSIRNTETGEVIRVLFDDPRITDPKYQHITTGTKQTLETKQKIAISNSKPQLLACCIKCRCEIGANNLARHQSGKRCRA